MIVWYMVGAATCVVAAVIVAYRYGRNQYQAGYQASLEDSRNTLAKLTIVANDYWRKLYWVDWHYLLGCVPRVIDSVGRPASDAAVEIDSLVTRSIRENHSRR
jgi:hypothetical protein